MYSRIEILKAFTGLGRELSRIDSSPGGQQAIEKACAVNGWFTPRDVRMAAGAIADRMLNREMLEEWAAGHRVTETPRTVVVVMAGNIPMAGLFDMLCVLVSGHRCLVKYSSKDRVMMEYISNWLSIKLPGIPIAEYDGGGADAIIASGSDNTVRYLRAIFGAVPGLYRGSMTSAAILDGKESPEGLARLSIDIFSYNGLGCRNVSRLLLPAGYDICRLTDLVRWEVPNPKYINNYRQRRAVLLLSGEEFTDCSGWLLRPGEDFPGSLSEITYGFYTDWDEAVRWVMQHGSQLQCIVAGPSWDAILPFGCVPFGMAQYPGLYDYPDRTDTMKFLEGLK